MELQLHRRDRSHARLALDRRQAQRRWRAWQHQPLRRGSRYSRSWLWSLGFGFATVFLLIKLSAIISIDLALVWGCAFPEWECADTVLIPLRRLHLIERFMALPPASVLFLH